MSEFVLFEVYLDILWHSLGMTAKNRRRAMAWWLDDDNHRNHFCVTAPDVRYGDLIETMVSRGWMVAGRAINEGRCRYYHVTAEGIKVARENFPRASRKAVKP